MKVNILISSKKKIMMGEFNLLCEKYYNREIDFWEIIRFAGVLKGINNEYIWNYFDFVKILAINILSK